MIDERAGATEDDLAAVRCQASPAPGGRHIGAGPPRRVSVVGRLTKIGRGPARRRGNAAASRRLDLGDRLTGAGLARWPARRTNRNGTVRRYAGRCGPTSGGEWSSTWRRHDRDSGDRAPAALGPPLPPSTSGGNRGDERMRTLNGREQRQGMQPRAARPACGGGQQQGDERTLACATDTPRLVGRRRARMPRSRRCRRRSGSKGVNPDRRRVEGVGTQTGPARSRACRSATSATSAESQSASVWRVSNRSPASRAVAVAIRRAAPGR